MGTSRVSVGSSEYIHITTTYLKTEPLIRLHHLFRPSICMYIGNSGRISMKMMTVIRFASRGELTRIALYASNPLDDRLLSVLA